MKIFKVKWSKSKGKWKRTGPAEVGPDQYFDKKKYALKQGKELARNQAEFDGRKAKLHIYKKNGNHQKTIAYSPGRHKDGMWELGSKQVFS